jgi:hypothetical protein
MTPNPMHQVAPVHWSQNATASAYVRWDDLNIGKDTTSGKSRNGAEARFALATREDQNGFSTAKSTIAIIKSVGTSLITL